MNAPASRQPRQPLSRSTARTAALINQCATPGLGSLIAGRRMVGIGQLVLAVAGFAMVIGWFARVAMQLYRQVFEGAEPQPTGWLGLAGGATFATAWLWSLVTSLSILREARAKDQRMTPPVLTL